MLVWDNRGPAKFFIVELTLVVAELGLAVCLWGGFDCYNHYFRSCRYPSSSGGAEAIEIQLTVPAISYFLV